MPCNKLAVTSGQVSINEALLDAVIHNAQALEAIRSLLAEAIGQTVEVYDPAATGWNKKADYIMFQNYDPPGEVMNFSVMLSRNGTIRVEVANLRKERGPLIEAAFKAALQQVAMVVLQNMVAATLTQNGTLVADEYTQAGRVMTLNL